MQLELAKMSEEKKTLFSRIKGFFIDRDGELNGYGYIALVPLIFLIIMSLIVSGQLAYAIVYCPRIENAKAAADIKRYESVLASDLQRYDSIGNNVVKVVQAVGQAAGSNCKDK